MRMSGEPGRRSILGGHVVLQLEVPEPQVKERLVLLEADLQGGDRVSGRTPAIVLAEPSARHTPAKGPCTYVVQRGPHFDENIPELFLHFADLTSAKACGPGVFLDGLM